MSTLARKIASSSSRLSASQASMRTSLARWMASRKLHMMRPLPYPADAGVGNFLPVPALNTVTEWQKGLLDRLNDLVRDTEFANQSIVQTIVATALHEEHTLAFNYASLALNNSFFLDNIKPLSPETSYPNHEHHISLNLGDAIRQQFGDLSQLKSTFSAAATGMSSSGWIWLVMEGTGRLAVLPTFGAGTLLVKSRRLMSKRFAVGELGSVVVNGASEGTEASEIEGAVDGLESESRGVNPLPPFANGPQSSSMRGSPVSGVKTTAPPLNPSTPSRSIHSSLALANTSAPTSIYGTTVSVDNRSSSLDVDPAQSANVHDEMTAHLYPLLCLSVHEHAWMSASLGVWGKEEYLRRFWSVVDWEKVSQTFERSYKPRQKQSRTLPW